MSTISVSGLGVDRTPGANLIGPATMTFRYRLYPGEELQFTYPDGASFFTYQSFKADVPDFVSIQFDSLPNPIEFVPDRFANIFLFQFGRVVNNQITLSDPQTVRPQDGDPTGICGALDDKEEEEHQKALEALGYVDGDTDE